MKRIAQLMLALAIALAGCAAPADNETGTGLVASASVQGNETATEAPIPAQVVFGLAGEATTRNESVVYAVESNVPISVTLVLAGEVFASDLVEGRSEWTLPLPFGHRDLNVTLEGTTYSATQNLTLVREAATHLRVDWCYFHPGHPGQRQAYDGDFWVDLDARPSEALYLAEGGTHRDYFTVDDLLFLFEAQTAIPIERQWFASSNGFLVNKIDGVGNPPYWNFAVEGTTSAVGVSEAEVTAGTQVHFFVVDTAEAPICT